jgi:hypothetical protein
MACQCTIDILLKTIMWHKKWSPLFYNHPIIQVKLTSVNNKFEYQIIKIFWKQIKKFIQFILFFACTYLKRNKLGHVHKTNDVLSNVHLDKGLKYDF